MCGRRTLNLRIAHSGRWAVLKWFDGQAHQHRAPSRKNVDAKPALRGAIVGHRFLDFNKSFRGKEGVLLYHQPLSPRTAPSLNMPRLIRHRKKRRGSPFTVSALHLNQSGQCVNGYCFAVVDRNALLPRDETKIAAKFQEKLLQLVQYRLLQVALLGQFRQAQEVETDRTTRQAVLIA